MSQVESIGRSGLPHIFTSEWLDCFNALSTLSSDADEFDDLGLDVRTETVLLTPPTGEPVSKEMMDAFFESIFGPIPAGCWL